MRKRVQVEQSVGSCRVEDIDLPSYNDFVHSEEQSLLDFVKERLDSISSSTSLSNGRMITSHEEKEAQEHYVKRQIAKNIADQLMDKEIITFTSKKDYRGDIHVEGTLNVCKDPEGIAKEVEDTIDGIRQLYEEL